MKLAMIGLGRMGGNMARRLVAAGHEVIAHARTREAVDEMAAAGCTAAYSLSEAAELAAPQRIMWLMLPAGAPTSDAIDALIPLLRSSDIIVNGANSNYKDSVEYGRRLSQHGIRYVDAGVSGGVWGLENGYGLMIGGDEATVRILTPIIRDLAPHPEKGWVHAGPVGAGHYVKMIHNGIEYGMMQAFAEGFDLMRQKDEFGIDLAAVAEAWRHGTVVRSWLLDLIAGFLAEDQELEGVIPFVADSGEGRWTVNEAVELGVPAPVLTIALHERFRSQDSDGYQYRLLAQLRNAFGGHAVRRSDD